jgi:hypothetical protein
MRTLAPLSSSSARREGEWEPGGEANRRDRDVGQVTILTAGSTITTIGIPVDAGPLPLFARPAIYATIFATPSVIEPN